MSLRLAHEERGLLALGKLGSEQDRRFLNENFGVPHRRQLLLHRLGFRNLQLLVVSDGAGCRHLIQRFKSEVTRGLLFLVIVANRI